MRTSRTSAYQEMMINSKFLEVPRGSYQRDYPIICVNLLRGVE